MSVNIRPEVTILSVLQHLNYRPWFALAEFVDNSLQSFLTHQSQIQTIDGVGGVLEVRIDIDVEAGGKITVHDNAAGISEADFPRAFRPAELPSDRSGLSEFGMGMKSAACWFARKWTVRTKALGEMIERSVYFDIDDIVTNRRDVMAVETREASANDHYTIIVLEDLHHPPRGRTGAKIREHLASIYRVFLRNAQLRLFFKGEMLSYEDSNVLVAPPHNSVGDAPLRWRKELSFDFGQGQKVSGFAALRETASTPYAGFALFRRNRLVEGSADETYRPTPIFGKSNSYRYQRLFGELHLEGFEVSHTKDGFRWEEYEDVFLDLLREELERPPLNLLDQAERHRVRASKQSIVDSAKIATERVADAIQQQIPSLVAREQSGLHEKRELPSEVAESQLQVTSKTVCLTCADQTWEVTIRTTVDPTHDDEWLRIAEQYVRRAEHNAAVRCVTIEVSLAHPFVTEFIGADQENAELLLSVAAAVALALIMTEDATGDSAGISLHYFNTVLRDALWKA